MYRLAFSLLLLSAPLTAQEPDLFAGAPALDRETLAAAVAARNPSLEAARHAWRAASARAPQERALANPMVSYSLAPLSVGSNVSFGHEIEVRQALPYPGKRQARAAMAEAEAEAVFQDWREALLELTAQASNLAGDWYLVHRALEVNGQHLRLLDSFREVAAARYAAGLAMQQDPLQAEVESAKLLQLGAELEAERRVTASRINALLHRDPGAPLPPPLPRLPELDVPQDAAALEAEALAARPELAGRASMIQAREAQLRMALLERRPDFEAMGSYSSMWMDREHRWMAGVAVDLPLRRGRTEAARTEAEARLAQARSERIAAEVQIRAEVREAWELLRESHHHLDIQRNRVLPATRDQIRAASTGFETGGSFLAVIEAERSLREAELQEHELLTEHHHRQAVLDRVLGRLPAGVEKGDPR
jgi:cobalt-zinc-cadmium efflux system outer membrane protein